MTKIYCEGHVVQLQRIASKTSGVYDGVCLLVSEIQEEPPFKIVDGRSDQDRKLDSEIEAWHLARKAWYGNCHVELKNKSRRDIRAEIVRLGGSHDQV